MANLLDGLPPEVATYAPYAISAFFGVLALFGLLLGLMRGTKRSIFRLIMVVLSAVLAFIVATQAAPTILSQSASEVFSSVEDVVSLPGGITYAADDTVQDVVVSYLESMEGIGDYLAVAPTLTDFAFAAVQAILSMVLFPILFFVFKFILGILGKLVDWIFLSPKGGRKLGMLIGILQGIFCAYIFLFPIFGLSAIIGEAYDIAVTIRDDEATDEATKSTCTQLCAAYEGWNDPVYTYSEQLGISSIARKYFYQLTTAKGFDGTTEVSFFEYVGELLPVAKEATPLFAINFQKLGDLTVTQANQIKTVVVSLSDTQLIGNTIAEAVINVSTALKNNESIADIRMPDMGDEGMNAFLNDAVTTLSSCTVSSFKADLSNILDVFVVIVKYDVIDAVGGEGDPMTSLTPLLQNEQFTTELLTAMANSDILSPLVVSAVNNLGISTIVNSMELPAETVTELEQGKAPISLFTDMTEEQKAAEITSLVGVFKNAATLFNLATVDLTDLTAAIDYLPDIGAALNSMASSRLLGNVSKALMKYCIGMDAVSQFLPAGAIQTIRDQITAGTIDYEATLVSIGAAFRMGTSLNVSAATNQEDMVQAVTELFSSIDENTVDIIKEAITDDYLTQIGMPDAMAETATSLIGNFFDAIVENNEEGIDYEKEAAAVESVLTLVSDVSTDPSALTDPESLTETLNTLSASETITKTLTASKDDVDMSAMVTPEQTTDIANILDSYATDNADNENALECVEALRAMFNIQ